ncbi:hypothetical protein ACNKHW_19270 [Shigella flexneri]
MKSARPIALSIICAGKLLRHGFMTWLLPDDATPKDALLLVIIFNYDEVYLP